MTLFADRPLTVVEVTRALDRLRARSFDTTTIEAGLLAMATTREPGDDADEPDNEDEDNPVPLGTVLKQLKVLGEAEAKRKAEAVHGSRARLAALVGSSERRRRGA